MPYMLVNTVMAVSEFLRPYDPSHLTTQTTIALIILGGAVEPVINKAKQKAMVIAAFTNFKATIQKSFMRF